MSKYVLCRPLGGFNDVLCQINYCYNYCIKYNRILLIDTSFNYYHNSFDSSCSFDKYFTFKKKIRIKIIYNNDIVKQIISNKELSIYPKNINDIFFYNITYNDDIWFNLDGIPLFANKLIDYDEDIIVHHTFGGGRESTQLVNLISLNKSIICEYKKIYLQINKPYLGIHIRNTDMKSNYIDFLNNNYEKILSYDNILLATDSETVYKYFIELFKNKCIYNFSKFLPNDKPLHTCSTNKIDSFQNTLIDLLLLINSTELLISNELSGFSKLVKYIHFNKIKCNFFLKNI